MHLGKGFLSIASVFPYEKYIMKDTSFEAKRKISGSSLTLFFCHSCIHISLQGWIPPMLEAKHSPVERDRTMKDVYGNSLFRTEMQLGQSTGVLIFSTEEKEFRHPGDRLFMRRISQNDRTWSNSSPWARSPRASCHLEPLQHLPHFLPQLVIQLLLRCVLGLLNRVWKQEATF